jgi:hypothetical protein
VLGNSKCLCCVRRPCNVVLVYCGRWRRNCACFLLLCVSCATIFGCALLKGVWATAASLPAAVLPLPPAPRAHLGGALGGAAAAWALGPAFERRTATAPVQALPGPRIAMPPTPPLPAATATGGAGEGLPGAQLDRSTMMMRSGSAGPGLVQQSHRPSPVADTRQHEDGRMGSASAPPRRQAQPLHSGGVATRMAAPPSGRPMREYFVDKPPLPWLAHPSPRPVAHATPPAAQAGELHAGSGPKTQLPEPPAHAVGGRMTAGAGERAALPASSGCSGGSDSTHGWAAAAATIAAATTPVMVASITVRNSCVGGGNHWRPRQ